MFKRGVVFINETVPYKIVAYLANKLYNESYSTVRTKHDWSFTNELKRLSTNGKSIKIGIVFT